MIKRFKTEYLILLIIIIAFALRLIALGDIPPHPSLDEVSIGYNAYSLLKTGADEFGYHLPILLRAYDDYRPAHYTYLVIPFVKIFGFNVFAVRLPSVLLSLATVAAVYFLSLEFFKKFQRKKEIALLAMFFIAVSPWHVYISRLGHEVNLFFSTFIFGITLFYFFLSRKKLYLILLSSFFFAISFSSYQSGKIFIPIILLTLLFAYYKNAVMEKFKFLLAFIVFILVLLPLIFASLSPQALVRFEATNIYSLAEPLLQKSAVKVLEARENNDLISQVINNRRVVYILLPMNAYISHLNPMWLFLNGGEEPFKVPNNGLLYIFDLPFIVLGFFILFLTKKIERRTKILLGVWMAASILPGAITTGFPHAMRTYQLLPVPHILIALGVVSLLASVKNKMALFAIVTLYIFSISLFAYSYFQLFPQSIAWQFQYGIKDAFVYAKSVEDKYPKIFVENNKNLFQSYMFYLFFNQYDPAKYQEIGGTISGGYAQTHKIGKYFFGPIPDKIDSKSLLILNSDSKRVKGVKKLFYFPDGKPALKIIEE